MKTKHILLVLSCLAFIACGGSGGNGNDNNGDDGGVDANKSSQLFSDVPPVGNVTDEIPASQFKFMCENNCGNGIHRYYTTSGSGTDILDAYIDELEAVGWNIENSGGAQNGASLQATKGDKYMNFNVGGGSPSLMHVDQSVWPSKPSDTNCNNCKVTDPDDETSDPPDDKDPSNSGDSSGSLTDDLPTPSGLKFQCQNNCGDGIHRYYTGSGNALTMAQDYADQLEDDGWSIVDGPGGISIGAGVEAKKGDRYIDFNAGGQSTSILHIDIAIWPEEPDNDNCQNCEVAGGSTDEGTGTDGEDSAGSTGDLLEDVPHVYGLEPLATDDCNNGKHLWYKTSTSPQAVTPDYKEALEKKGWTVTYNGGGSSYGWGLTATKGQKYLKMNIGGYLYFNIDMCVWPSEPADKDCDQDCND